MRILKCRKFFVALVLIAKASFAQENGSRYNILFAISDDQSYPHASAYGTSEIETPAFDGLARRGMLFHNAFSAAPGCSPSRAAILTGRNIWQLEEAAAHNSLFPRKFQVFTRALEEAGYHVGFTGKPWSPGDWKKTGWDRNPVGDAYNTHQTTNRSTPEIYGVDYERNFKEFLSKREGGQPFFFWYGAKEPHRDYGYGSGVASGKSLEDAKVPPFLPDHEVTRNDFLDYLFEIEWFDRHLGLMLEHLESIGELENTIVVVTSDNGMPFPYGKANLQEFGTHVPFVIAGPILKEKNRETHTMLSLIDLAPTFLEIAGLKAPEGIPGRSLLPFLRGEKSSHRSKVLTARERHTHARPDNLGYPARALRTRDFLYIRNLKPQRWPAGIPPPEGLEEKYFTGSFSKDFKPIGMGYNDIDASPAKELIINNRDRYPDLFQLAFLKRPAEQLYHIRIDPWCLNNLARNPNYNEIRQDLARELQEILVLQRDPRITGGGDVFETYPRVSPMRYFPGFKERGEYGPPPDSYAD